MKPQIPGYLGNILLYPQDVASALAAVSRTLEVDGESYCETAKCILEYAGGDRAAKKISEALKVLPKALQQVKNNGAGLLTLSRGVAASYTKIFSESIAFRVGVAGVG